MKDWVDKLLRKFSEERYAHRGLNRQLRKNFKILKASKLEGSALHELNQKLGYETHEWREWLRAIETRKLEARGKVVGAFVDDIPIEFGKAVYTTGPFGDQYFNGHYLTAFRNLVRERELQYRKDRREKWMLVIQVLTAISGLIGTAIGLVSALKR